MQARFLLGPAGSGKTFRCLAEIRAELIARPDGPTLILLAPKQATFQLERQLLADPSLPGYTRLHILSFERLATFVLDSLGVPPPQRLSEEGRVMVLRALLMRHQGKLRRFRASARAAGLANELSGLLGELQHHHYTAKKLIALSERKEIPAELRDKLHDLALLLDAYDAWLKEHSLQDADSLPGAAVQALRLNAQDVTIASALWLDGFAELTPAELELLAAIAPHCGQVTLAFCLEAEPQGETSWLSTWSVIGRTFLDCRAKLAAIGGAEISVEVLKRNTEANRFTRSPALAELESRWSNLSLATRQPSSITISACANPDAEAVLAARELLRFVREGGRFREAAVLVRNLDSHHKSIARVFRRYEIPFFLDRRESVTHHPLAELTRSALRTVAWDWQHADWFAALKTGFAPVDETDIDRLENEALEHGWRGAKWLKPFSIPGDEPRAQWCERLRQKLTPPFATLALALSANSQQPTGSQLAAAIRKFWRSLDIESRLEEWSDTATDDFAAPHSTVLDQMNAWLDNVAMAFPSEPLGLRAWLQVLEAGLAKLSVGAIPPALDQVLVGAIDRSRNPELKLALVLGLNEGVFPATPPAPVLLTESDRDTLGQHGGGFGLDLRGRIARERYLGYIAFTRASERLVLTHASQDVDGGKLNDSPFLAHLRRIFPGLKEEAEQSRETVHVCELIPQLVGLQRQDALPPNWSALLQLPRLAGLASALRRLRNADPKEALSPALAGEIYPSVLRSSVSRLEQFAACPFRFFVHSGLRAEERVLFELDSRARGDFQHKILELFHDGLKQDGKRWRDITPEQARERIQKISDALTPTHRGGLLDDSEQARFEARVLTAALQDFIEVLIGWMRGQYGFDPAAVELGFGGTNDEFPGWEIALDATHKLVLQGRIDRVDLWHEPGADSALCVVMDYKSSAKKLDATLLQHGVQMQLPAYLSVLRHWREPKKLFGVSRLIPAGVFYVNLRGSRESAENRTMAATVDRKLAYQHTGRFDAAMLEKLDSRPDKNGDQFKYRRNKDGSLHGGSVEAMDHAAFTTLLDNVEAQLTDMGQRIFAGETAVDPYRKGNAFACDYCAYRAVCRIDPWTHRYRVLSKPDKQEDGAT